MKFLLLASFLGMSFYAAWNIYRAIARSEARIVFRPRSWGKKTIFTSSKADDPLGYWLALFLYAGFLLFGGVGAAFIICELIVERTF